MGQPLSEIPCSCGSSGTASMREGGKLTWRVDWPARWPIPGVTVEPFGKDHASTGGSYDTGKRISSDIFGYPAPHPIVYEWINLIIRGKPEKHIEFDPGLPLLNQIDEYENLQDVPKTTFHHTLKF